MPTFLPLIFILLVLFMGIAAYFGYKATLQRREALMRIALERGWTYAHERSRDGHRAFKCFDAFQRGHSRRALNTLTGDLPVVGGPSVALQAGDYSYRETSGAGKDRHTQTYTFSYAVVRLPWMSSNLSLAPENFFHRIGDLLGFDDIDFESEEFSRRFRVKSPDKRFAYDLFHPRMMEFLLTHSGLTLEIEFGWLLLVTNWTWRPEEFERYAGVLASFLGLWPPHLRAAP
jgi:hypothetical protein